MTLAGWFGYGCFAIILIAVCFFIGYSINKKIIGAVIGIILSIIMLLCFLFYYNCTAVGKRAYKTQKSNLSNGINRKVTVYDIEGDVIKTYSGKFDVTYDNNRILFDDENGKRHMIYYTTGTVTVDEE